MIAEVDVHNTDAYAKEVGPNFAPIIKAHGGRALAQAGAAGAGTITSLIGAPASNRVAVVQFENMAAVQAFWSDPKLVSLIKTGQKYASFRNYAVDGLTQ